MLYRNPLSDECRAAFIRGHNRSMQSFSHRNLTTAGLSFWERGVMPKASNSSCHGTIQRRNVRVETPAYAASSLLNIAFILGGFKMDNTIYRCGSEAARAACHSRVANAKDGNSPDATKQDLGCLPCIYCTEQTCFAMHP